MSDNVIQFSKGLLRNVTINHGHTILVIRPDGTKLRGGDMVPIAKLPPTELIEIIDELCDLIARR